MSIFSRWFGGVSPAAERQAGDQHFEAARYFEARQCFERITESRDASAADKQYAEEGIVRCQDRLAEQRIAEADRLFEEGQIELARVELQNAIDTARSKSVIDKAQRKLDGAEKRAAKRSAKVVEIGDEERWALLAGNWEDAQIDEYDGYGETLRTALLALAKDDYATAGPLLEGLAKEHGDEAVYLWLEVARVRSSLEKHDNARIALKRFLKRVPDEDRSEARVNAYAYLAQLAERAGEEEQAIEHLNRAIEVMPDDPRPFVNLGAYLRAKGHAVEAIDVLEAGIALMDEDRPNPIALQELGLAKRDAGKNEAAIEALERVIRIYVARAAIDDFPPGTAVPLAQLHEKNGNLARAADLWASLTRIKDPANTLVYHREAARVLGLLGERREARRFLARAQALAGETPLADSIEMQLLALDKDD